LFDNYKNKNKNSIIDFVCILSVFLNEDESDFTDYSISDTIGNKLNNDINNLISFSNNIIQDECLSKKYVCIIYEWCNNESLNNICKNYGLFEGNVIRMINKLLNLLQEIKTGYESILEFEWTLIIDDVHNFIYKDILDTPSIYVS
jgi:superfamily II RNA helicase